MRSFNFTISPKILAAVFFPFVNNLPTPPSSEGVNVGISFKRSNLKLAPESFFFTLDFTGFETNSLTDQSAHDVSYGDKHVFWSYGDETPFTAPENTFSDSTRNSGFSRGPLGSHTYKNPGNYVVNVSIYEPSSGLWGHAKLNIGGTSSDTESVGDRAVAFAGDNTFYVKQSGDYTGSDVPTGALGYNTLEAAFSAAVLAPTPKQIVIARGEVITVDSQLSNRTGSNSANAKNITIVAADGPGAKPQISPSASFVGANMFVDESARDVDRNPDGSVPDNLKRDYTFQNISFVGGWDSTTETGTSHTGFASSGDGADVTLFDGCDFNGWSLSVFTAQVGHDKTDGINTLITFNDCDVTNWRNMGFFISTNSKVAFTGNKIMQHVDAMGGGVKTNSDHNEHGPFRLSVASHTVINNNDLFSNTGWFPNGDISSQQPCVRCNTSSLPGARISIADNTMEGGSDVISHRNANASRGGAPVNSVIQGNFLVATALTQNCIGSSYSGITIRNNYFIVSDVLRDFTPLNAGDVTPLSFLQLQVYVPNLNTPENYTSPVILENNTIVSLITAEKAGSLQLADFDIIFAASEFTNHSERDTLYFKPRQPSNEIQDVEAVLAFNPRFKGYKDANTNGVLHDEYANPVDSGFIWYPTAAATNVVGQSSGPQIADFFGNQRPQSPSIGAFEPR